MTEDELDQAIAELPRTAAPPPQLWSEIESRIRPARRRWTWAAALVGMMGVATAWAIARPPSTAPAAAAPTAWLNIAQPGPQEVKAASSQSGSPSRAVPLMPAEGVLRSAADDLSQAYAQRRSLLDEQLLAVFDDNLALVDDAIERSRSALIEQPEDRHLQRVLRQAYGHKLALLQRATAVEVSP